MGTYVKRDGQLEEIAGQPSEYVAGTGIEINENVINALPYTAGNNISINEDKEISCDISTMNFRGTVETYAELPEEGQIVGDVWNVSTTNVNYCWDGSNWIAIGSSIDVSGLMNKDGSNAVFPEHTGSIPTLSTMLINGGDGLKERTIEDVKASLFPVNAKLTENFSERPIDTAGVVNALKVLQSTDGEQGYRSLVHLPGDYEKITGVGFKVQFVHDIAYSTSGGIKIYIAGGFTEGFYLKVYKHGEKVNFEPHKIGDMFHYATVGTILDIIWDGIDFVIVGNPEVITGATTEANYVIKADGFIDIQIVIYNSGSAVKPLPVKFTELNYKLTSPYALRVTKDYDNFTVKDYHTGVQSKPASTTEIYVFLMGY